MSLRPGPARRRRGAVIAISGVDGSGKSTHVRALVHGLRSAGVDAVAVWLPFQRSPHLSIVAAPIRRVLRPVLGDTWHAGLPESTSLGPPRDPSSVTPPTDAARRDETALGATLRLLWAGLAAVHTTSVFRRSVRPLLRRGTVVVCDRYVLDARVHLRFRYGPQRRFAPLTTLIAVGSPRPGRAYLLDVPGEVARRRKPVEWSPAQLAAQTALYREEAHRLGITVMDGERTRDGLARAIRDDVLDHLGRGVTRLEPR